MRIRITLVAVLLVLAYAAAGPEINVGVWGDRDRDIQPDMLRVMAFTEPAQGRIAASAQRVRAVVTRSGIRLSAFEVRQTTGLYRISWKARRTTHLAGYLWGMGIVLADTVPLEALTDTEMDCVLAHE